MPRITLLPGDGIGPEVVAQAEKVLQRIDKIYHLGLSMEAAPIGGAALAATGQPLPAETLEACRGSKAILLGAVGGPQFDQLPPDKRPEMGLLQLRKELEVFSNLRPVTVKPALAAASPLKTELLAGIDLLIVRELTGGIYFGQPRGREKIDTGTGYRAVDTMVYTTPEIERIAKLAFSLARKRRGVVTSVDKANVLECSRLWREVVTEVAKEYPQVTLEHQLVDSCAMEIIMNPARFDVILAPNMFGDILSDEASVLAGTLGLLPSASLGQNGPGIFEPIHGSAPSLTGKDEANPLATILSAALLLRHALHREEAAQAVERAVDQVLTLGYRTSDIASTGSIPVGTREMGDLVCQHLNEEGGCDS